MKQDTPPSCYLCSNPLRAFVVDDNPEALATLANDLRNMKEFAEVKCFSSYEEATLPLLEIRPDVLFLVACCHR